MAQNKLTKPLLPGYYDSLRDRQTKERYRAKLGVISGVDPYEASTQERMDKQCGSMAQCYSHSHWDVPVADSKPVLEG